MSRPNFLTSPHSHTRTPRVSSLPPRRDPDGWVAWAVLLAWVAVLILTYLGWVTP